MNFRTLVLSIVLVGLGLGIWLLKEESRPRTLTLVFKADYQGTPFEFDRVVYENPGGNGIFGLRDFRFYLTNLVLHDDGQTHVLPDSYHLVRFDAAKTEFRLELNDIPLRRVTAIDWSIGLDEMANSSIETRGDVDPNSRMAWNWAIGYKFVLAEGVIEIDGVSSPLVYHVGFDENRRDQKVELANPFKLSADSELTVSVDIAKMFTGRTRIDLSNLQTIKMDRGDAAIMADNYSTMLSISAD